MTFWVGSATTKTFWIWKHARHLLLWFYVYNFGNPLLAIKASFLYSFKDDLAVLCGIQGVIGSATNIDTREKSGAALAHQNIASVSLLASVEFYP